MPFFSLENSDLMFIQYVFDGKDHEVQPAAQGNCTTINSPVYVCTKESTVKSLQTIAQKHTPKEAYNFAHKENGSNLHAESLRDLPRNRSQAKYQRHGHTNKSNFDGTHSLVILLVQCKRQQLQRHEQPFIREFVGAPELWCILRYDWQIEDIVTFCTNDLGHSKEILQYSSERNFSSMSNYLLISIRLLFSHLFHILTFHWHKCSFKPFNRTA